MELQKGIPEIFGAGGVIFYPGGNLIILYAWGLGEMKNNQDEAYALYQGLILEKDQGYQYMVIMGDSKSIISLIRIGNLPSSSILKQIIQWILWEISSFRSTQFYHVK
jgi:ribonuclease HI